MKHNILDKVSDLNSYYDKIQMAQIESKSFNQRPRKIILRDKKMALMD